MALAYEDFTEPERRLWGAVESGEQVDLSTEQPELTYPGGGASWGQERVIRASVIAQLAVREGANGGRQAKLAGARITGALILERVPLIDLFLRNCWFEEPVSLVRVEAERLVLSGCYLPALQAAGLAVQVLHLDEGFTSQGEVNLFRAYIGDRLFLDKATVTNPDGIALNVSQITSDKIIHSNDVETFLYKTITKVRAEKASAPSDEHALFTH